MPIQDGQYVAPTWNNNAPPPINAEELQAICDTLAETLPADQILSATTIAMWGLQSGATPDEVFQTIYEKYSEFLQPIITLDNFYTLYGVQKYLGSITGLSVGRASLSATTVGNYALFGGGNASTYSTVYNIVDSYAGGTLIHGTAPNLSSVKTGLAATTVGGYALFAGGSYTPSQNNTTYYNTVDTYTSGLVKGTATGLSVGRASLSATTVGNYALFGGGNAGSNSNVVDSYTGNLVHGTPTTLSTARYNISATTVGNYALFGGGTTGINSNVVDAYNQDLIRTNPETLTSGGSPYSASNTDSYAIFSEADYTAEAYSTELVKTSAPNMPFSTQGSSATSVAGFCVFVGSVNPQNIMVCAYNDELTICFQDDLDQDRGYGAATTIGEYALYGGGLYSSSVYANVNAIVGGYLAEFTIPAMSQYKINGYANQETFTPSPIDVQIIGTTGGVTGYIKTGGFTLSGLN